MESLLIAVALVAAFVGIACTAVGTAYRWKGMYAAASIAWVVLTSMLLGTIVLHGIAEGRIPLSSRSEYLLALGFAVSVVHLFVWFKLRLQVAGLVIPTVSALATLLAWNVISANVALDAPRKLPGLFLLHTTFSTLGIATLCLSFTMSVLYLVQDRALKVRRRLTFLERFPALERCDHLGFQAMLVGFVLLSIGIATGVVVNLSVHERVWVFGIKQDTAALTWFVFGMLLVSRRFFGFRGRKSAYLTIAGFALGLATVVGMTI